jgi:DNA invertase Pin-like site-specific DNA recombinase
VDTLSTVRKLKEKGIEIHFEKENIYTLDSKGELLITIISSLAQEESRSISENTTWGIRKRFADGKVSVAYSKFIGYEKGEDDNLKIVEDEAKIVRQIFSLYLQGKTFNIIAKMLTERGVLTPTGQKIAWHPSTVGRILQNEQYKGDAVLQKHFTVDFLTKKHKINMGEVPQYYVQNSHPAIVDPEVFDLVQSEIAKRKPYSQKRSAINMFSNKIICGQCGEFYGSKVWHSTDKYRRVVWRCNAKYKNAEHCQTPHLSEDTVKWAFVQAFNQMISGKSQIISDINTILPLLTDTVSLDKEAAKLADECAVVAELIRGSVEENARSALDQDEYQQRYDSLISRYDTTKNRLDVLSEEKMTRSARREILTRYIHEIEERDGLLAEFDEALWYATVDSVTVFSEKDVAVQFKYGEDVHINVRGK